MMTDLMGYAHPKYALSLQEFGEPRELPNCGGWILVRQIPGTPYKDAMGCYPLFACRDWTRLRQDLEHVGSDLVSLTLVTDPFSGVTRAYLEQCFDLVKPFKTHYVVDLSHPLESFVNKGHRKNARKSLEMMDIEVCCQPIQYLDHWIRLYDTLISRHKIKGINAFSPKCFEIQLSLPGMVMVLGRQKEKIIGATLILIQNQETHFHLSAFTDEGYKIRASYGTHWKALVYGCEQGTRYFNLGGAAGITEGQLDGLSEFKRGWSNDRRMAYLCGRIFDRQKYDSICEQYHISNVKYFPVYRAGEFGTGTKNQLP
jgi:hypothetical protein